MITQIFTNFLGGKNVHEVNRIRPIVSKINRIEDALHSENSAKLLELTAGWQNHLARYHPFDLPAKHLIEAMDEESLRATAETLEARLAELHAEFPAASVAARSPSTVGP